MFGWKAGRGAAASRDLADAMYSIPLYVYSLFTCILMSISSLPPPNIQVVMFGWKAERGAAASHDEADVMNFIHLHMHIHIYT